MLSAPSASAALPWCRALATAASTRLQDVPSLQTFLQSRHEQRCTDVADAQPSSQPATAAAEHVQPAAAGKSVFIKTYGCQMNVSDSELVTSILGSAGYSMAGDLASADVVLLNTCAIRDKAEARIWGQLQLLKHKAQNPSATPAWPPSATPASPPAAPAAEANCMAPAAALERRTHRGKQVVGVLGCMAERLKDKLLEGGMVDVIAGPDAYRDLPRLLADVDDGASSAMNVALSAEETYADVAPVRPAGSHAAFVSITRGAPPACRRRSLCMC